MTIDYVRRHKIVRLADLDHGQSRSSTVDHEPSRSSGVDHGHSRSSEVDLGRAVPRPSQTPAVHSRARQRPAFSIGTAAAKLAFVGVAALGLTHGHAGAGLLVATLAALSWWRVRQALRFLTAVALMALVRHWVVKHTPTLDHAGAVADPAAPWRVALERSGCGSCGE